mgnify:CR=1 FL=1
MGQLRGIEWGRKEVLWYGVALALFAGLLYAADINEFVASIRQVDPLLFGSGLAIGFSSLLVWAWVWHRFFGQLGIESTVSRTVRMFLTGHFLNSITPLGQFGGEPIMAFIVSDTTGTDYETALACVVSSDIVNAAPFFTFPLAGIVYLAVVGTVGGVLTKIGVVTVGLLVIGGGVAYLLWSDDARLGRTVVGVLNWIEGLVGRGDSLFASLRESVHEVADAFERAADFVKIPPWHAVYARHDGRVRPDQRLHVGHDCGHRMGLERDNYIVLRTKISGIIAGRDAHGLRCAVFLNQS